MIYSRPVQQQDHLPQGTTLKKGPSTPSAPVALGIVGSLDSPPTDINSYNSRLNPEEHYVSVERFPQSDHGHQDFNRDHVEKKEKRRFWNRDKDKEKEKEREREREKARERDEDPMVALSRMIGEMKRLSLAQVA